MRLTEVHAEQEAIRGMLDDIEAAHYRLDALYESVLAAICAGATNAVELADAALATGLLVTEKWYA